MRVGDQVRLDIKMRHIGDVEAWLLPQLVGKSVLEIGAAGGVVEHYLPGHIDRWRHAKIKKIAADLVGIDIDAAAIAHAARHGWPIAHGDCETIRLGRTFDAALMLDVIEHLEAPGRAIANVLEHLNPGGLLYIATPNPTHTGDIVRAFRGRAPSVYWDHQIALWPEHLQSICDRHGFVLRDIAMIGWPDQRSATLRFKSAVLRMIGGLNPRLSPSWLGVVTRE
jgi:SAM-dependent methyltransferase